jgi:hypothetical protein
MCQYVSMVYKSVVSTVPADTKVSVSVCQLRVRKAYLTLNRVLMVQIGDE